MRDLEKNDNPLTTSHLTFEVGLGERHQLSFSIWPMESKDRGVLNSPVVYLGKTFPAGVQINSDWILFDSRIGYLYDFAPSSPLILMAGTGGMVQYHKIKLSTHDETVSAKEDDVVLLPFLSARAGYRFTEKVSFYINCDGGYLQDAWMVDAKAVLNYRINRSWDFSVGFGHYARDIEGSKVQNRIVQNLPYLGIAYSW
jgi:hypothetical protein